LIHEIEIESFLRNSAEVQIIDVRSPAEFEHAHIPGAINIPLFDNEERAIVGTIYNSKGSREAILTGLEFAGKKIRFLAEQGLKASKNNELLLHCWRGGMRSASMAWLFEQAGINSYILKGGYKSYRRFVREYFSGKFNLCVLGGMTGSGKSEILNELEKLGYQVIHLEKIANHKGSAFGSLGQLPQNSNEQFENDLFTELYSRNSLLTIWIEDESLNIGRNIIPSEFFKTMKNSPLIVIKISRKLRVKRLVKDYGKFPIEDLCSSLNKISRRLGGLNTQKAILALEEGKPEQTAEIVLDYYDKTYNFSLKNKRGNKIFYCTSKTSNPRSNVLLIEAFTNQKVPVRKLDEQ
jgi:tRNA 2-selenouridine synthase